jgi:hypothetical protein
VTSLALVRYAAAPDEESALADQPEQSELAAPVAPDPPPVPDAAAPAAAPVASSDDVAAPVVKPRPKKVATAKPVKAPVAASAKAPAPIAAKAIAKAPARADVGAAPTGRTASVSTESAGPAPVTLTGCLEMSVNRDAFRLSDTDGADAPRARTWRTGFLTKRPIPVALVQAPDPHDLQVQVGKRVAATGLLIDRELKVSSVRVVGASCGA